MRMSEFYLHAAVRCRIDRGDDELSWRIARTLENFARHCRGEEEAQIAVIRRASER